MRIELNGRPTEAPAGESVLTLLEKKGMKSQFINVAVNGEVVSRDRYPEHVFKEGDRVEFIYQMGGGVDKR
jgi:sulfur carrier protein